ncbi:HlyD family type I secretion periplasmic adaptor subunit [Desulforhopalus sp. 52FAK]
MTDRNPDTSTQIYSHNIKADKDLITDIRTTILIQTPAGGRVIIWSTLFLLIALFYWMAVSEIEEVTRGTGKVIPSRQIQVIQNLEGGILAETYVKIGDIVQEGQMIMRLDETRFSAPFQEYRLNYLALLAKAARLRAETEGSEIDIPQMVRDEKPEIAARERQLYVSRQQELTATLAILNQQIIQRKQELLELKEKKKEFQRTYVFLKQEIDLTEPLIAHGAVSEVELLRLKRELSTLQGEITSASLAIPRIESKLTEAYDIQQENKLAFINLAKKELNEVEVELESMAANAGAIEDRLERTVIRSPVYGTVKQVLVNTVGGVVQPGMDLIEIVPLEDTLLVEAQIKPSDIAFLRPAQRAMVKFTAYDFTIYGGLEAELEHISADSITTESGMSFYVVRVRTDKNYLEGKNGPMPIIPGMVTTVDILTGKKTILSYLLKPILRAKGMAFREK